MSFILGVLAGLISSVLLWMWLTWGFRARVDFGKRIEHESRDHHGTAVDHYSIVLRNVGWRAVLDPKVRATLRGQYRGGGTGSAVWDIPVSNKKIMIIARNTNRRLYLRYDKVSDFVRSRLSEDAIKAVDSKSCGALQAIMNSLERPYLHFEMLGFDGLSGTRSYFSSGDFGLDDIKSHIPTPSATKLPDPNTADAAAVAAPVGNPALIGVPTFLAGSIALGLVLVGYVPATAGGASTPIIMTATGIGQLLAAGWAARLAQNAVASIFGIFTGFWLSYAALVLGLTHNWFGIVPADVQKTQKLFLLTWLIIIVLLTLATLRLPLAFTVLFVLIDLALLFVYLGTSQISASLTKVGGYFVFSFVAVGAYLFFDAMSSATGGKALPLGNPLIR